MATSNFGGCNPTCACSAQYKTVSAVIYCTDPTDLTCGGLAACGSCPVDPSGTVAYGYGICAEVSGAIAWLIDFASTLISNADVAWGTTALAVFDVSGTSPTSIAYNAGSIPTTPNGSAGSGWTFLSGNLCGGLGCVPPYQDNTPDCPTAANLNPECTLTNPCLGFLGTIIAVQTNCSNAQIQNQPKPCCNPCTNTGDGCLSSAGCWESAFSDSIGCFAVEPEFSFVLPCPPADQCTTFSSCDCYVNPGWFLCGPSYFLIYTNSSVNITIGQCKPSPGDPFGET